MFSSRSNSSYSKVNDKLDESNKGHQLLRKMGWGGAGLGAKEQGIEAPISAGEVITRLLVLFFYKILIIVRETRSLPLIPNYTLTRLIS